MHRHEKIADFTAEEIKEIKNAVSEQKKKGLESGKISKKNLFPGDKTKPSIAFTQNSLFAIGKKIGEGGERVVKSTIELDTNEIVVCSIPKSLDHFIKVPTNLPDIEDKQKTGSSAKVDSYSGSFVCNDESNLEEGTHGYNFVLMPLSSNDKLNDLSYLNTIRKNYKKSTPLLFLVHQQISIYGKFDGIWRLTHGLDSNIVGWQTFPTDEPQLVLKAPESHYTVFYQEILEKEGHQLIENTLDINEEYPILNALGQARGKFKYRSAKHNKEIECILMELVDGITLKEFLKQPEKISVSQFLEIANYLLDQLLLLVEKDIIHRDIKPSNIMIDLENNKIRFVDFGQARFIRDKENKILRASVAGSRGHCAPEIERKLKIAEETMVGLKKNATFSERTDLFSAALVLNSLLDKKVDGNDELKTQIKIKVLDKCLEPKLTDRPYVKEISESFKKLTSVYNNSKQLDDKMDRWQALSLFADSSSSKAEETPAESLRFGATT